jgi:hypothetical protein
MIDIDSHCHATATLRHASHSPRQLSRFLSPLLSPLSQPLIDYAAIAAIFDFHFRQPFRLFIG